NGMRNLIAATFAAASLLASAAGGAAEPAKGEAIDSALEIGKLRIALPPGKWNVVAEHTGKAASSDGIPNGAMYKGYYLVQFDQDHRLVGSFYARATTTAATTSIEWRDKTCGREDTLFRAQLGAPPASQDCVIMNHQVRYLQARPRDPFEREAWQWM